MEEIIELLGQEVVDNCETLKMPLQKLDNPEIRTMAYTMAYEPTEYGTIYEDGTQGLIVRMPEDHNTYNNGVYMLHLAKGSEDDQYLYQLEVIVPNTKSKDFLIRHLVGEITTYIDNLDTGDLDVYDFAEIYGFVIANTYVKPLAKSLYPNQKDKQVLFTNLYMPRTLAHIAHIYAGSETLKEQAVNSDPYLFKLAIDGLKEGDIAPNHEVREDAEGILNNDEI